MNTQNDFLDNTVDAELAIDRTEDLNAEMCSYMQSDTEKMCSSLRSDTCGSCVLAFQTSCKTDYRSGIGNE